MTGHSSPSLNVFVSNDGLGERNPKMVVFSEIMVVELDERLDRFLH